MPDNCKRCRYLKLIKDRVYDVSHPKPASNVDRGFAIDSSIPWPFGIPSQHEYAGHTVSTKLAQTGRHNQGILSSVSRVCIAGQCLVTSHPIRYGGYWHGIADDVIAPVAVEPGLKQLFVPPTHSEPPQARMSGSQGFEPYLVRVQLSMKDRGQLAAPCLRFQHPLQGIVQADISGLCQVCVPHSIIFGSAQITRTPNLVDLEL